MFPIWDVATAPLGHYFASASADHTARVWVTERAQSLRLLAGETFQHGHCVVAFTVSL